MTKASGTASRQAAAHTADILLAERAARFREREQGLHRLLTDYHHATAQAQKIHQGAQARAAKITADAQTRIATLHERADKQASAFEDAAHAAVRALLQLGEPRSSVASLTHLTAAQVRAIEHAAPQSAAPRQHPTRAAQHADEPDTPSAETTQ